MITSSHHSEQPTTDLIPEFIKALDQEIPAIKAGKGGSTARVFDGRFIREDSGIFVYSFTLEDFITTLVDDAPVEVQVGDSRYQGPIIQVQGLEVIIGLEHNFGPSIPQARIITNLYFLHEMLKKKFEAIRNREVSPNLTLSNLVFRPNGKERTEIVELPRLEPHPHPGKTINRSQLEAIKLSQRLPLSLVWGPPGTGKTETLARIVECFIKQGMRALVVAHANAAVDEATEDIAQFLENTDFYKSGQIIRLGNCQKETLITQYEMVHLERIAERLGGTLKHEKEQLEQKKVEIERTLQYLDSIINTARDRNSQLHHVEQLDQALLSNRTEVTHIKAHIIQQQEYLKEFRTKLEKAESSGAIKRLFLGLDPVAIRREITLATVRMDEANQKLRQCESQVENLAEKRANAGARLSTVQKRLMQT